MTLRRHDGDDDDEDGEATTTGSSVPCYAAFSQKEFMHCDALGHHIALHWNIVESKGMVTFGVHADVATAPNSYFAIGISETGGMKGMDVHTLWHKSDGSYAMLDGFSTDYSAPSTDNANDLELLSAPDGADNRTVFTFQRALDTCDDNDIAIVKNVPTRMTWAFGAMKSSGGIGYHQKNRGHSMLLLYGEKPKIVSTFHRWANDSADPSPTSSASSSSDSLAASSIVASSSLLLSASGSSTPVESTSPTASLASNNSSTATTGANASATSSIPSPSPTADLNPSQLQDLDIKSPHVILAAGDSTICSTFSLSFPSKTQIVRSKAIVEHESVLRMLVYACESQTHTVGETFSCAVSEPPPGCSELVFAWSNGMPDLNLTDIPAGIPIGSDAGGNVFLTLQVVYLGAKAGSVDSSGVTLSYTTATRANDIGFFEFGSRKPYLPVIESSDSAVVRSECPSECTKTFTDDVTLLVGTSFAMDASANNGSLRIVRGGVELPPLGTYRFFEPEFSSFQYFSNSGVSIQRGDSLISTCSYPNAASLSVACQMIVLGYPRQEKAHVCHSLPSTSGKATAVCASAVDYHNNTLKELNLNGLASKSAIVQFSPISFKPYISSCALLQSNPRHVTFGSLLVLAVVLVLGYACGYCSWQYAASIKDEQSSEEKRRMMLQADWAEEERKDQDEA